MPNVPARAYMLCTTPRSGSTLLCRMLAATGVAGQPDSHFHTPSLSRWLQVYGLEAQVFDTRKDALRAVIEAALMRGTGETGCFGLRMQRGSFPYAMAQFAGLYPGLPTDRARLETAFGPMRFLHLSRADKVAQAVSRLRAEQGGLWHARADGSALERSAPTAPLHYDRAAIAAHVAELSRWDEAWAAWFAQEGITPLRLSYAALAETPRNVLAQALGYLGRDASAASGVRIPTARLANAESAEWVARFRAETDAAIPPRS
ncbi:MAG: Stf0 family sulfotransferase [Pseudomonadota bacterium]